MGFIVFLLAAVITFIAVVKLNRNKKAEEPKKPDIIIEKLVYENGVLISKNGVLVNDTKKREHYPRELLYPARLKTFEEIARDGHADLRALVYTMKYFSTDRTRPFFIEELQGQDFGENATAFSLLLSKGLVQKLKPAEELVQIMLKNELVSLAEERGLSTKGRKSTIAERLAESGYKIDREKYKEHLFYLSQTGKTEIERRWADKRTAIKKAIEEIKNGNRQGAIAAYREYDASWGFSHASGKNHTIFAHYNIPEKRFTFFTNYPMQELNNSEDYKSTLRACLFAGLMRGCQDHIELARDFESVCSEELKCPGLLYLFDYSKEVINNMREQIAVEPICALGYYISHVEYLSRQEIN